MKVTHYGQFEPIDAAEIERAYTGVTIRRVISEVDGAESSVMDIFEIAPGGQSPYHRHPWDHQVFVISGRGWCRSENGQHEFGEGDVIYVKPGELHSFGNSGDEAVKLVCVIPKAALAAYHLTKIAGDDLDRL
ncbi:MAG: cupin domain-containing protein [Betaproteobacteria bacterium]